MAARVIAMHSHPAALRHSERRRAKRRAELPTHLGAGMYECGRCGAVFETEHDARTDPHAHLKRGRCPECYPSPPVVSVLYLLNGLEL
jgi:DNA-directed RNA polymerase subunit RPC12/RpoP